MAECKLLPLLLLALAVPGWGQESKPYVWGQFARRLTPGAVSAAVRIAAADEGPPWAFFADESRRPPETHELDAFLPPAVSTDFFRRGKVQRLECRPAVPGGSCSHWRVTGKSGSYIQVADKERFSSDLVIRTKGERPIIVDGVFEDNVLLSLVTMVRSNPTSGGIPLPLPQENSIRRIGHCKPAAVCITLTEDGLSGVTMVAHPEPDGWAIVEWFPWKTGWSMR